MKIEKSRRRDELLSKSTEAEKSVCRILKSIGVVFIRQYPIDTGRKHYYADIYIPSARLIIEVDGGYHYTQKQMRLDRNRSAGIRRLGYHICRIDNKKCYSMKSVIEKIRRFL